MDDSDKIKAVFYKRKGAETPTFIEDIKTTHVKVPYAIYYPIHDFVSLMKSPNLVAEINSASTVFSFLNELGYDTTRALEDDDIIQTKDDKFWNIENKVTQMSEISSCVLFESVIDDNGLKLSVLFSEPAGEFVVNLSEYEDSSIAIISFKDFVDFFTLKRFDKKTCDIEVSTVSYVSVIDDNIHLFMQGEITTPDDISSCSINTYDDNGDIERTYPIPQTYIDKVIQVANLLF